MKQKKKKKRSYHIKLQEKLKRSLDRSKLIVSEAEPETFADAALFSNQRSGRVVGDVGADVHHDLRRQRDVHERILFPSRCLEVVWIVQRLRRHRNGSRKMAGLNQALRLSEGKSRSLISLFQRPTGIDFGIDSGLSSDFPFVLHFLSSSRPLSHRRIPSLSSCKLGVVDFQLR